MLTQNQPNFSPFTGKNSVTARSAQRGIASNTMVNASQRSRQRTRKDTVLANPGPISVQELNRAEPGHGVAALNSGALQAARALWDVRINHEGASALF